MHSQVVTRHLQFAVLICFFIQEICELHCLRNIGDFLYKKHKLPEEIRNTSIQSLRQSSLV